MKADLALRGLAIGGRTVERATLDVDGRSNDHRIALQAEASGLELRSEGGGALRDASEATDESTIASAMEAVEKNPDQIQELLAALTKGDTPADPVEAAKQDAENGVEY